jgi:hypothetical protein
VRADLREPALGQVRKPLVQRPGDGQLEDAVAEKFQPLVGIAPVGRPRGVRERVVEPPSRKLVDEQRKLSGVPDWGGAATGAT